MKLLQLSTACLMCTWLFSVTWAQDIALEEIVVTAQKREQNLQSVPLAITAVTSEELQQYNVFDAQQMTYLVPGMQFSLEGEDVNIFLRGNPGTGTPLASSGTVTLYGDGILRQVTSQFQAVFTDVSRVEVSRGPQGTLSGRNAFAGSINVVTNPPEFAVTRFGFNANIYNYSGSRVEGFLNVPLGDVFALRLSAYRERQDGVIENILDRSNNLQDRNNDYGRLQLGFHPVENINGVLRMIYWKGGGNGSGDYGAVVRGVSIDPLTGVTTAGNTTPWTVVPRIGLSCTEPLFNPNTASVIGTPGTTPPLEGGSLAAGPCNTPVSTNPYVIARNSAHVRDIRQAELNGEINWDIANRVRLRALMSYVNYKEYRQADGDYGPSGSMDLAVTNPDNPTPGRPFPGLITINEDYERTRTQEIQLLSIDNSSLQWVVGGYFEQNSSWSGYDLAVQSDVPGTPAIVRTPRNFNTNPQTLICCGGPAGGAFIWYFPVDNRLESKSGFADGTFAVTDTLRLIGGARYTRDHVIGTSYFYTLDGSNNPTVDDQVFSKWTWRAGLQHDLTHYSMLYLTESTGFIAGGSNPGGAAPYSPQMSKSFELGSKNTLLHGSLRFNADIYSVKYSKLLVSYFNLANSLTTAANAGDSHATGVEFESAWQATHDLKLRLVGSWMHSRYGDFVFGPSPLVYEGQNLPAQYGPNAQGYAARGLTTRNAPTWQFNGSLDYDLHVGGSAIITPGLDVTYVSHYRTWAQPYAFAFQDGYWQTNLRATWHHPQSNWSADLYVNNLQNKPIRLFTTLNGAGVVYDQYQDPRMYGIRLHYRM